jgi:hypothetical protein
MMTSKARVKTKKAQKARKSKDKLLIYNDLLVRRVVWAENLQKAKKATKLYQQYKNGPEQFRMTFAEYKRRSRSS